MAPKRGDRTHRGGSSQSPLMSGSLLQLTSCPSREWKPDAFAWVSFIASILSVYGFFCLVSVVEVGVVREIRFLVLQKPPRRLPEHIIHRPAAPKRDVSDVRCPDLVRSVDHGIV